MSRVWGPPAFSCRHCNSKSYQPGVRGCADGRRRALTHPQCKGCERFAGGPVVSKFAGEESRDRVRLVHSERIEIIADLTARLPSVWYAPAERAPCCVNCKIMPYDSQLNSDAPMSLTARDIAPRYLRGARCESISIN